MSPEIRTKFLAACPAERDKICTHDHTPYRGPMPCTGPRVVLFPGALARYCGEVDRGGLCARRGDCKHFKPE